MPLPPLHLIKTEYSKGVLKTHYPHPVLKIIVFKSFFRVLFFELTRPPANSKNSFYLLNIALL